MLLNCSIYLFVPIQLNAIDVPMPIGNSSNQTIVIRICMLENLPHYKAVNILYLVQSTFVPFAIMLTTTLITVRVLFLSRSRVQFNNSREMSQRRRRDIKFAVNSVALNVLFFIFLTPITLVYLIPIPDPDLYLLVYLTFVNIYFLNFSVPFFIYLVFNSIFRRELLKSLHMTSVIKEHTLNTHNYRSRVGDTNNTINN